MKTKRMIAGLAAAATLIAATVSSVATAAESVGVKISSQEVKAGGSYELTLSLENIPSAGINACDFGISYDSSLVTVDSLALADGVTATEGDLPSPFEYNIESDVVSVMYALGASDASSYLKGSTALLTISGTVNKDAKAGSDAVFKIVPVDRASAPGSSTSNSSVIFGCMGADGTATAYTPQYTDGHVTVAGSTVATDPTTATDPTNPPATEDIADGTKYGDVNVDNDISVADVVELNKYLLNTSMTLKPGGKENADVVRDNSIDTKDSTLLVNYIAEMVDYDQLGK